MINLQPDAPLPSAWRRRGGNTKRATPSTWKSMTNEVSPRFSLRTDMGLLGDVGLISRSKGNLARGDCGSTKRLGQVGWLASLATEHSAGATDAQRSNSAGEKSHLDSHRTTHDIPGRNDPCAGIPTEGPIVSPHRQAAGRPGAYAAHREAAGDG